VPELSSWHSGSWLPSAWTHGPAVGAWSVVVGSPEVDIIPVVAVVSPPSS
jgi:hypothetical protein